MSYKLVSVKTKQCRRCLTSHLNRIYNGHVQKCRCLCKHSLTKIEVGLTAKIILVSPASILVGEWLQRQRHIGAWPLYILFKCDVRHRLHCFVCTDTHLFNFTKGKTDLVNQRWRRPTCLKHQCYDVGCYPCDSLLKNSPQTTTHTWKIEPRMHLKEISIKGR